MSDWRRAAAGRTLARYLEAAPVEGPVLVLRDADDTAARAFSDAGVEVERWDREARPGVRASPWPPPGPFATAALRLPRAKEELEMWVHAAAGALRPGGVLLVYGANDEGIRSAPGRVEPLFGEVDTVMVKNRCRVLRAERPAEPGGVRGSLEAWRETWTLEVDGLRRPWVSYPGVFAHGRLDAGTALLLETLAPPEEGGRILDFGCGSGVLAGVLLARQPAAEVEMLDVDAVALAAARENVPGARAVLADGLAGLGAEPFDWIVSNPPYHRSKAETLAVVEALIREAPERLEPGGRLVMVVQRRLPVEEPLRRAFRSVESRAGDGTYRVWEGRRRGGG